MLASPVDTKAIASGAAPTRPLEVCIIVTLSGSARAALQREAFASIPWDRPWVKSILVLNTGPGKWDWDPDTRRAVEARPRTRIFDSGAGDSPAQTLNLLVQRVTEEWFVHLHDDDFFLTAPFVRAIEALDADKVRGLGLVAFGWYSLVRSRFVPYRASEMGSGASFRQLPKFCGAMINTARFKELGGTDPTCRGWFDLVLFESLARRFGVAYHGTQVGVFREHAGQFSSDRLNNYLLGMPIAIEHLLGWDLDVSQFEDLTRRMVRFAYGRPTLAERIRNRFDFHFRGSARPRADVRVEPPRICLP